MQREGDGLYVTEKDDTFKIYCRDIDTIDPIV